MLNFTDKLKIFKTILNKEECCYSDSFNYEISIYASNFDYDFLNKINSEKEIENWIWKIKSRIVMHEHEDRVEEIIVDYIDCG